MSTQSVEKIAQYPICALSRDACINEMAEAVEHSTGPRAFACANPHSLVVAEQHPDFKAALMSADWLTPDGQGIVLVSRLMRGAIRERVTGTDIFIGLSRSLSERGRFRVFFLGSTPTTLEAIAERFTREFPSLEIAGTLSPPFKTRFTQQETDAMVAEINQSRADVLWVGMTAPKQELWVHQNLARLDVKFVGAIGAVFDFYAGTVRRPARMYRELGLEWLVRLLGEPRRLWRRTFVSAPQFAWLIAKQRLSGRRREQQSAD